MRHYGFNFTWMFVWQGNQAPLPDEKALDFLAAHGFNFVRVPTDYRYWTKDFDYLHPDEDVWKTLDQYLDACRSRGIHMCLNFHRGPGYCINRNNLERDNLWLDEVAQDGFIYQWTKLAQRYKGVSSVDLSFDLINEPPFVGQYGMTRGIHADIMSRVVAGIREIDPDRRIVVDGLGAGNLAMPELAHLDVVQSCRGYAPMAISHYQASWWPEYETAKEEPFYPGIEFDGRVWNRQGLIDFYQPWLALQKQGVEVHAGEFGCYNKTPHKVALAWLGDLMGLWKEWGWGYSMWNFEGNFGIINHGRPGARYENVMGYEVDRDMLDLMMNNRVLG